MMFESFWFYKAPVKKLEFKCFPKESQNGSRCLRNSLKAEGPDHTLVSPVSDGD